MDAAPARKLSSLQPHLCQGPESHTKNSHSPAPQKTTPRSPAKTSSSHLTASEGPCRLGAERETTPSHPLLAQAQCSRPRRCQVPLGEHMGERKGNEGSYPPNARKQKQLWGNTHAHALARLGVGKSTRVCCKHLPIDSPTAALLHWRNTHTPSQSLPNQVTRRQSLRGI